MDSVFYKVIENETRRNAVAIRTPFGTWSVLYDNGAYAGNLSDDTFNKMFDSAWQSIR